MAPRLIIWKERAAGGRRKGTGIAVLLLAITGKDSFLRRMFLFFFPPLSARAGDDYHLFLSLINNPAPVLHPRCSFGSSSPFLLCPIGRSEKGKARKRKKKSREETSFGALF
jgi:hypothetical protein